jgi:hypothetical protein
MEHTMRKSGQAQHTMIMGWLGAEARSIPARTEGRGNIKCELPAFRSRRSTPFSAGPSLLVPHFASPFETLLSVSERLGTEFVATIIAFLLDDVLRVTAWRDAFRF